MSSHLMEITNKLVYEMMSAIAKFKPINKEELFLELSVWLIKSAFLGEIFYVNSHTSYWEKDSY